MHTDTLAFLRCAMADCGAATQTFAAVRRIAKNGETFASVRVIADYACLPVSTVKRHLRKLFSIGYLEYLGREKRRTPTYRVPKVLLNKSNNLKFALLPRCLARLPHATWGEKAVLACVVSRQMLCADVIGDSDGQCHGRLAYAIANLSRDTGLAKHAIIDAKRRLVDRGILNIDPAMTFRDELGRIRAIGDTLTLNLDYQIPVEWLALPVKSKQKPVAKPKQKASKPSGSHRGALLAPSRCAFDPDRGAKVAPDPVRFWHSQLREDLKESSERSSDTTPPLAAERPDGVCVTHDEEKFNGYVRKRIQAKTAAVDIEDRAALWLKALGSTAEAETA